MKYSPLQNEPVDDSFSFEWEEGVKRLRLFQNQIEQKLSDLNTELYSNKNDKSNQFATSTFSSHYPISIKSSTSTKINLSSPNNSHSTFSSHSTGSSGNLSTQPQQITARNVQGANTSSSTINSNKNKNSHSFYTNYNDSLYVSDNAKSSSDISYLNEKNENEISNTSINSANHLLQQIQDLMFSSGELIKQMESSSYNKIEHAVQIRRFRSIFSTFSQEIQRFKSTFSTISKRQSLISSHRKDYDHKSESSSYYQEKQSTSTAISMVDTLLEQGNNTISALTVQHNRLASASQKLSSIKQISRHMTKLLRGVNWLKSKNSAILAFVTFGCILLFLWFAFG